MQRELGRRGVQRGNRGEPSHAGQKVPALEGKVESGVMQESDGSRRGRIN